MLTKCILLFFVGLLTATSAFSGIETKSFFGLKHSNSFLPYFHNLKSGMIGYLYETSQYLQFDISKGDFTIILTNLTKACGQKYSTYDPLHYHVNTSTLVYYCLANNTLLILNETNFTVNNSIPINVTSKFDQVRLYSEGRSIVILGLTGAFTSSSSPTQLLKISLKTNQVTKQFTLKKGLLPGEVVTAYASTKLLSFVLTMTYTDQINSVVTIYSLVNVKNLFKLVRLVAFSMHFSDQPLYTVLSDLNILGQFLVTNDNSNLLFYNLTGALADTFYNIGFNTYGVYLPTVTMSPGSPELYALFANQKILGITTDGLLIPSYIMSNASSDMHLATGTQVTPDMLLAVNPTPYTSFDNLTITNLGTGQLAYTAPAADFDCLYITNTTFTGVSQYYIYVFNLTTNLLVYYREVASRAESNYYDQVAETLYFIESTGQNYQIGYLNLQTLDNGTSYPYNISINYNAHILHVKNGSDPTMPSFVIQQDSEDYSIFTAASGVTTFSTSVEDQSSVFLVPNYDNMSFYFGSTTLEQGSTVYQYLYNFTNMTYELQNSYRIWESYFDGFNSYYIIDSETAVFIYRSYVMEYKLPNTKVLYQSVTDLTAGCTGVYDNKGDLYLILEGSGSNDNYVPTAFDLNNQVIDSLWKVSNISDNSYAASAGYSSLMITTGTYQGSTTLPIQLTKFYNVSAGNSSEDKVSVVSY